MTYRLPVAVALMGALGSMSNACAFDILRYSGMCDASAAVPVASHHFVVANDKDSVLRIYDRERPGLPVYEKDFSGLLGVRDPETDLEGGTRIGDRLYWIASHSATGQGDSLSRRCLFAARIALEGPSFDLSLAGRPYTGLLHDLELRDDLKRYHLDRAARLPPESLDGLNIEGLSRTPEGGLLIAFRNPRPGGKALLVTLKNPAEVTDGRAGRFGKPVLLDLGGRGIRSIEYSDARERYFIVAGPHDDEGTFAFFEWSGHAADRPQAVHAIHFDGLNPEALVLYADQSVREQVLSDDRGDEVNGRRCLWREQDQQSFRSLWIEH